MKKILLGGVALVLFGAAAHATDMPMRAPVRKAPDLYYDWSGLYVGVYTGIGAQQSRGFDPTGGFAGKVEHTGDAFNGGATAGYNWQVNRNWVVGVEGDIGYLGFSHNVRDFNEGLVYNNKTSWIATARGRIGYTNGPNLNYITAGGAWVGVKDSIVNVSGVGLTTSSKTESGYAIGTGVETMLGGNWTAKAESLYVDLGKGNTLTGAAGFTLQNDVNRYQVMKFGLNYLFGGKMQPPLMAHNWSGLYLGGVAGTSVGESRGTSTTGTSGQFGNNGDGFTVGGTAGYNWHVAPQWVVGVEGDFSYLGIDHLNSNYNDNSALLGVKTSWLATARGRIGYSTGPALLYLTAGGGWVNLKDTWYGFGAAPTTGSKTVSGGAFGGGIETVIANSNWTSKTEYLFIDGGKGNVLVSGGNGIQVDHSFHVFRSGLAYHFSTQ